MSSLLNDGITSSDTLTFDTYNANLFEYFLDSSVEAVSCFNGNQNSNSIGDFLSNTEEEGIESWNGVETVEEGSGVVIPYYSSSSSSQGVKAEALNIPGANSNPNSSDGNSEPNSPDYDTTIIQSLGDNLSLQQNINSGSSGSDDIELGPEDMEGDESEEMLDDYLDNENETEEQGLERRSKKRKIGDLEQDKVKTAANTKDLEELTKQIQEKRPLSNDEEQLFKRQRRLIKNRESAQKSRLRKKKYVEELELKVKSYADFNTRLIEENKNLKEDVGYLATIIRKTPNIPNDVLKGVARRPAFSTANAKAAGVVYC